MMDYKTLFQTTFLFFIILDPIANLPIYVSALKHIEPKRQKFIIYRENFVALIAMLIFFFFGAAFFRLLSIDQHAVQIAGGVILFIIGARMLFSAPQEEKEVKQKEEPFIVPLAIPAVAGPGILATITLFSANEEIGNLTVFIAILLSWALSLPCLLLAPHAKKFFNENGLIAIERLSAYLVIVISIQMAIEGIAHAF